MYIYVYLYYTLPDDLGSMLGHFGVSVTEEVPGSIKLGKGNSLPLRLGLPYHRSRILEIFIYRLEGNFAPINWPDGWAGPSRQLYPNNLIFSLFCISI